MRDTAGGGDGGDRAGGGRRHPRVAALRWRRLGTQGAAPARAATRTPTRRASRPSCGPKLYYPDSLHIIVDGTCDLKEDGLSVPLNPGESFGSQEQLHGTQHISTITAWPDKCTIATLTGNTFASLRKRFEHVSEFVAMFEQMERERRKQVRREHGGPVGLDSTAAAAEF